MVSIEDDPIIAAVRGKEDFAEALESASGVIFLLHSDIFTAADSAAAAHKAGKTLFFHADLADGIGKDLRGVEYLAHCGADGIISTRSNMIRFAKEQGLLTVQRVFVIDAQSVKTSVEAVRSTAPDFVEIMPGVVPKVVASFKEALRVPIITGGLIETKAEIIGALNAGASAVSTSAKALWNDR